MLLDTLCVDVGHAFAIARIGVARVSILVNLKVLDDDRCRHFFFISWSVVVVFYLTGRSVSKCKNNSKLKEIYSSSESILEFIQVKEISFIIVRRVIGFRVRLDGFTI